MRDTLRSHLEHRTGVGYRRMMEATAGLDEVEARRRSSPGRAPAPTGAGIGGASASTDRRPEHEFYHAGQINLLRQQILTAWPRR